MTTRTLLTLLIAAASATHLQAQSADRNYLIDSAGLRAGVDADSSVSIDTAEVFATFRTPCQWKLGDRTVLTLKFEGAVGILKHHRDSGIYARIGPHLELRFGDSPLRAVASSGPAFLSDHTYGPLDLGGDFQFFSSIGLDWDFAENWSFSYRWEHISNANLHDENPGLNMHVVGFTRRF